MNITLDNLKKAGFKIDKVNKGEFKGDYDCFHNDTGIQIYRDKNKSFWTDICGKLVDLKSINQISKIITLVSDFTTNK